MQRDATAHSKLEGELRERERERERVDFICAHTHAHARVEIDFQEKKRGNCGRETKDLEMYPEGYATAVS